MIRFCLSSISSNKKMVNLVLIRNMMWLYLHRVVFIHVLLFLWWSYKILVCFVWLLLTLVLLFLLFRLHALPGCCCCHYCCFWFCCWNCKPYLVVVDVSFVEIVFYIIQTACLTWLLLLSMLLLLLLLFMLLRL